MTCKEDVQEQVWAKWDKQVVLWSKVGWQEMKLQQ